MRHAIPLLLPLLIGVAGPCAAQVDRYELGVRLARLERGWERATEQGDAAARARALPHVEAAVRSFFTMQTQRAVQALDTAWLSLTREDPSTAARWAASLTVRLERRLLAPGEPLRVEVRSLYEVDRPAAPARVSLVARGADASQPLELPLGELPARAELATDDLPAGDGELEVTVRVGDLTLAPSRHHRFTLVSDPDARLAALAQAAPAAGVAAQSYRGWVHVLERLRKPGAGLETEYPGARLLADAERLAAAPQASLANRPGEHWLRLPAGRSTSSVRLWAPQGDGPFPLVLALHGAGGSENMFFDTYGAGKVVGLCQRRGWLLVAPRLGFSGAPLPELVDAIAELYPVDRARVFVVGHSMGAAQAMAGVNADPQRFTAVAILGGGGQVQAAGLSEVPFFVGVGERDFGASRGRSTAAALRELGASVDSREYPGAEHLLVVQDALGDVFEFFERSAPEQPAQERPRYF